MEDGEKLSLEQIRAFLEGSGEVHFQANNRADLYEWVNKILCQHVRKHMGYGHIASARAEAFDEFYRQHFNPYLNFTGHAGFQK